MKGFLQHKDQELPKTHNLRTLCDPCIELDNSFETILDTAVPLNRYITASRYPVESLIDETITQTAITQAQAVYDFALSKVPGLQTDTEKNA